MISQKKITIIVTMVANILDKREEFEFGLDAQI